MTQHPKILPIFVMHTNLIYNEVEYITIKAETKNKGRHTGASPAALFRPRLRLVCGDRPPLFNFKFFIMHTNKSDSQSVNSSSDAAQETIILTPGIIKLLKFLNQAGVPDIISDLRHIYDQACYFTIEDLNDKDRTALHTCSTIIELLTEIHF